MECNDNETFLIADRLKNRIKEKYGNSFDVDMKGDIIRCRYGEFVYYVDRYQLLDANFDVIAQKCFKAYCQFKQQSMLRSEYIYHDI